MSASLITRSPQDLKDMHNIFDELRTPLWLEGEEEEEDDDNDKDDNVKEVEIGPVRGEEGQLKREDVSAMTSSDGKELMAECLRILENEIALALDPIPDSLDKAASRIAESNRGEDGGGIRTYQGQTAYEDYMTGVQSVGFGSGGCETRELSSSVIFVPPWSRECALYTQVSGMSTQSSSDIPKHSLLSNLRSRGLKL